MYKLFLIKNIYKCRWCKLEDNYSLNIFEKLFYTFKAILCVLFARKFKGKEHDWYKLDYITVSIHSFSKVYNYNCGQDDANFIEVTIGRGVLNNWYYLEMSNGWL